jgi:hypothetical protein
MDDNLRSRVAHPGSSGRSAGAFFKGSSLAEAFRLGPTRARLLESCGERIPQALLIPAVTSAPVREFAEESPQSDRILTQRLKS